MPRSQQSTSNEVQVALCLAEKHPWLALIALHGRTIAFVIVVLAIMILIAGGYDIPATVIGGLGLSGLISTLPRLR